MQRNDVQKQNIVRNLLFCGMAVLLVVGSLAAAHQVMVHAAASQRTILSMQAAPLLRQARFVRAADPDQQLNLSIGLQVRNEAQMDAMLSAMYDPQSPQYQHYLTPEQFTQMFAPTPDQVQQVTTYLQSQGLTITGVASDHLLIDASGSVAQVQQTFQTKIDEYQFRNRRFYANATPPGVPTSISGLISSIGGLDNSQRYQPFSQQLAGSQAARHTSGRARAASDAPGLAPTDIARAYTIAPLQNNGILGEQQTIALFELDGYQPGDVAQYFSNYGIDQPKLSTVLVDHFNGSAGMGAIETELDIEIAGSIAPHANILVYEGPNTVQGINDTYARIVNENRAQVVSISWGICEASTGVAELKTLDTIFKQGAMQGMSFVAAAGDSGAYDCQDNRLAVDSPADDPYVTGVGATMLQLNNGGYGNESVWADRSQIQRGPMGGGSGGGLSTYFKQFAWQNGPGVRNAYSNGNREVPDVTAAGASSSGYSVYCTVRNAGCPPDGWTTIVGTSAAAPVWAASLLLINQYASQYNKGMIGQANPALYRLLNTPQPYPPFHDITSGNNLFYAATVGYDLASGIGSPNVYNIARDLVH
jgi:subtilase family serine protease